MKTKCPKCGTEINAGTELAKKRWAKEKPDKEFLAMIGRKGGLARAESIRREKEDSKSNAELAYVEAIETKKSV